MSNLESNGCSIEPALTFVRTVQPADFDLMQRLREVQPADSEMMQRLLDPESIALYSASDKFVGISSPETRFLDEWKRLQQQAIIREKEVRAWSQAAYARFAYFAHWFPRLGEGVRGDYELCWSRWHQHYCEGLTAAANLFANETYNSIRFRKAEEFPQFDESLHSVLKAGEPACSYADWKQGFTLGSFASERPEQTLPL